MPITSNMASKTFASPTLSSTPSDIEVITEMDVFEASSEDVPRPPSSPVVPTSVKGFKWKQEAPNGEKLVAPLKKSKEESVEKAIEEPVEEKSVAKEPAEKPAEKPEAKEEPAVKEVAKEEAKEVAKEEPAAKEEPVAEKVAKEEPVAKEVAKEEPAEKVAKEEPVEEKPVAKPAEKPAEKPVAEPVKLKIQVPDHTEDSSDDDMPPLVEDSSDDDMPALVCSDDESSEDSDDEMLIAVFRRPTCTRCDAALHAILDPSDSDEKPRVIRRQNGCPPVITYTAAIFGLFYLIKIYLILTGGAFIVGPGYYGSCL